MSRIIGMSEEDVREFENIMLDSRRHHLFGVK